MTTISDISEAELPASLQGLGQLTSSNSTLSIGQRGSDVLAMQKVLISFGYPLSADGIFGPKTEAAVKAVQGKLGLIQTGRYDPTTRAKVMSVVQSGVIDATAADKQKVASATSPGSPSSQVLTIAPSLPPVQQSSTGVTIAKPDFLAQLKAKYEALLEKYPKALPVAILGTGLVVVAGLVLLSRPKGSPSPVQVMGLPKGKRKASKKRKTSKRGKKS